MNTPRFGQVIETRTHAVTVTAGGRSHTTKSSIRRVSSCRCARADFYVLAPCALAFVAGLYLVLHG